MPGVEQVASFGQSVHVVGTDHAALQASVEAVAQRFGIDLAPGETTLEDVFIRIMSQAERKENGR
jgi:ABC-2 type transport system ATP-binding protein